MISDELLDTNDMGLTIALLTQGMELISLEQAPTGNKVTFRFQASTRLDQLSQDYWSGRLLVDAKSYWNESKNLKARLYSLR